MEEVIIKVEDLTIAYHDKPVLWDSDVNIVKNSITAVIGPNGAGKSTLIKGILGIQNKLSGEIRIKGEPFKRVQKIINYIPQASAVNWDFPTTVLDVVLMGRYVHLGWIRRPGKKDVEIAKRAIDRIGLSEFENRQISQLSGGQRQRVFIARAIAQDAEIYFMDEPLAGVDKLTEGVIVDFFREEQKRGRTFVVVHHDLSTIKAYFDHLVILNKKVIAEGRTEDVFTKENMERAMMLGGGNA
ncbi:MAG: metal ABC transporter ATP-binding protein [Oribacterium sp.]